MNVKNPYLEEYNNLPSCFNFAQRLDLVKEFAFAIPDQKALNIM